MPESDRRREGSLSVLAQGVKHNVWRREEGRACAGGHVTDYFMGGSREELERARQTQCYSRITHLAKLNPIVI